jgi:hypothetical protein
VFPAHSQPGGGVSADRKTPALPPTDLSDSTIRKWCLVLGLLWVLLSITLKGPGAPAKKSYIICHICYPDPFQGQALSLEGHSTEKYPLLHSLSFFMFPSLLSFVLSVLFYSFHFNTMSGLLNQS